MQVKNGDYMAGSPKMGAAENLVLMAQPSWAKGHEPDMQPLGLEEVLC